MKNIKKEYYSQYQIVKNYDNFRFGGKYGKMISSLETKKVVQMLTSEIQKNKLILDLPTGTGRLLKELSDNNIIINTVAADYSYAMLDYSKKNNLIKPKFCQADVFNLPFKKNSFDIITSIRFLSHYPDTEMIIKNLTNLLKPGGILIFDTYLWSPRKFMSLNLGGKVFTHTPNQIKNIINSIQGLEIVKFDSNFIISPLFHRYLPGFINNIFFKIEKYINKKYLVRQYWKIIKK